MTIAHNHRKYGDDNTVTTMNGQIIILAGSSGAGKTTAQTTFAKLSQQPYLMFGFDQMFGSVVPAKYSMFGEKAKEGFYNEPKDPNDPDGELVGKFGPVAWGAINAFHEMIAAASRQGQNVIVDHFTLLDPPILQDCAWRLADLPVLFVALKPPYDALKHRLETRNTDAMPEQMAEVAGGNEAAMVMARTFQRMTSWFYHGSYESDCFDLVLDTTTLAPEAVCQQIQQRLDAGPGTAFESIRQQYSKP